MLIANNCTRENGQFMGDQLCYVKIAYLMVQNSDCDKIMMSMSPANEMHFVWQKFIDTYNVEVIYDNFNPGDNIARWDAWDKWRKDRSINGRPFDEYRELYLRIHGLQRQTILCGGEIGKGNIFEYIYYGQEHLPKECIGADWFDDTLCYHPEQTKKRDVYIAPHCKTQGNAIFTFEYWREVIHHLLTAEVSVTIGYENNYFDVSHPLYTRYWGDHKQWFDEVCKHKLVACGNTGTGWVSAACGIPLITMEPHNSCMQDHRYRQCGLKNIVEVIDGFTLDSLNNDMNRAAEYCANRIIEFVKQKVVLTTGCYDILHAGHILHLQRSKALGTKLIVALNSDSSVKMIKGESRPINSESKRKSVLEAIRYVDEVYIFDGPTAIELIKKIQPYAITAGYGYKEADIVGKDLVEKAIITCTDADGLSTTNIAKKLRTGDIVEICKKAESYSVNPLSKLIFLAEQFQSVAHLSGDVADIGTCRGGSAYVLRQLTEKHLHCFDTWAGTPYDDPLCHHKAGSWPASLEECQLLVGNAHYHQGVFPEWDGDSATDENYRPAGEQFFCFVYIDTDTYQSVKDAIIFFELNTVYGAKIVIDDYDWEPCAGVKKAVDEIVKEKGLVWQMSVYQHTCILTRR